MAAWWQRSISRISVAALPTFNQSTRKLQRLIIGHARELELDKSGRILVPGELRQHAELGREAVLVGQSHRFELWSAENWNSNRDSWLEDAAGELVIPEEMPSLSL